MLIEFTVGNEKVSFDPDVLIAISDDMHKELTGTPSDIAKISRWIANIKHRRDAKKDEYDAHWGRRYHELKAGAYKNLYALNPTELGLESALSDDNRVIALKKELGEVQETLDTLYGLQTALSAKMESLKELGSHFRLNARMAMEQ